MRGRCDQITNTVTLICDCVPIFTLRATDLRTRSPSRFGFCYSFSMVHRFTVYGAVYRMVMRSTAAGKHFACSLFVSVMRPRLHEYLVCATTSFWPLAPPGATYVPPVPTPTHATHCTSIYNIACKFYPTPAPGAELPGCRSDPRLTFRLHLWQLPFSGSGSRCCISEVVRIISLLDNFTFISRRH